MTIVTIAWLYVTVMMAAAEATSSHGTLLGAGVTFVLYGALPLVIVRYIMGTPARKRARQAMEAAGDSLSGIFTLQSGAQTPNGHIARITLVTTSDSVLVIPLNFNFVLGSNPVAIIDADQNYNSGPAIQTALHANGMNAAYFTSFPEDLDGYSTLFVCLGTGSRKHVLTPAEGQLLAAFAEGGGNLYMEGGDTWYYDPKTAVHPLFNANGISDGNSDLSTETAEPGSFADGLSFTYAGDKEYIDHLEAVSPAFPLFRNTIPQYISAVACNAGSYRTIASVFEFGGLQDSGRFSTRNEYMQRIIDFFELLNSTYTANFLAAPVSICENGTVAFNDYSVSGTTSREWNFPGGNPVTSHEPNPIVTYAFPGKYDVTLIASNGSFSDTLKRIQFITVDNCLGIPNTMYESINIYPNPATDYIIINSTEVIKKISVFNTMGAIVSAMEINKVSCIMNSSTFHPGLYFLRIETNKGPVTKRVSIVR